MRIIDYLKWQYDLKLDRNGYAESVITKNYNNCFICGGYSETRHELQFGTSDRKKSKAMGLWIPICATCHRMAHNDKETIDGLHMIAQKECDRHYGEGTFYEIFGVNYL